MILVSGQKGSAKTTPMMSRLASLRNLSTRISPITPTSTGKSTNATKRPVTTIVQPTSTKKDTAKKIPPSSNTTKNVEKIPDKAKTDEITIVNIDDIIKSSGDTKRKPFATDTVKAAAEGKRKAADTNVSSSKKSKIQQEVFDLIDIEEQISVSSPISKPMKKLEMKVATVKLENIGTKTSKDLLSSIERPLSGSKQLSTSKTPDELQSKRQPSSLSKKTVLNISPTTVDSKKDKSNTLKKQSNAESEKRAGDTKPSSPYIVNKQTPILKSPAQTVKVSPVTKTKTAVTKYTPVVRKGKLSKL